MFVTDMNLNFYCILQYNFDKYPLCLWNVNILTRGTLIYFKNVYYCKARKDFKMSTIY